jgi:putative nucleotidyltransferase with HDIG domain
MRRQHAILLLTAGMLGAGTWVVRLMGGTASAFTHVMYIPIVTAAIAYGPWGGIITGLIAGLLMAETPVALASGQMQPLLGAVVRTFFFAGIGTVVGTAMERQRHQQREMRELMIQSVTALTRAMEERHRHTAGHSLRVAEIASSMGRRLGLSEHKLFLLQVGSLLHDIGKLAVPLEILDKPGRLTPEEYRVVQEHVSAGNRILEPFDSARMAAIRDIVRHHHERLDGSGYPDRLQGGQISLLARIVAVADVFDALTSVRPYRTALPHAEAMLVLRQEAAAGKLDARLVHLVEQVVLPPDAEAVDLTVEQAG